MYCVLIFFYCHMVSENWFIIMVVLYISVWKQRICKHSFSNKKFITKGFDFLKRRNNSYKLDKMIFKPLLARSLENESGAVSCEFDDWILVQLAKLIQKISLFLKWVKLPLLAILCAKNSPSFLYKKNTVFKIYFKLVTDAMTSITFQWLKYYLNNFLFVNYLTNYKQ